jgi:D-beta-D-heptose 7-phosphate kinase/D-beta-D-heptose 1-phosphate adenosyltransferase
MDTNLSTLFSQLTSPTILVVGDLILDRYLWGDAERVSPEAPVLVLRTDAEEVRLGGAASVAILLQALNAEAILAGVIGDDSSGRVLTALFDDAKIDHTAVQCEPDRVTTTKDRYIGRAANRHPNQILRVDREVRHPIHADTEAKLIKAIIARIPEAAVVLISDYAKGVCTPGLLDAVKTAAAKRSVPVFVDPARITDYERYRAVSLLLPNRAEAELATGRSIKTPDDAFSAGRHLGERYGVPAVLVKLDRDGMALVRYGVKDELFPAKPRAVYDVTGAGDLVLAVAGLCQAANLSWKHTVQIANVAAGLEVEKFGVAPVSRQEICAELSQTDSTLASKIITLSQMRQLAVGYRANGKKIVLTNGCFDLLHIGHVTCLLEAARMGNVLVVAVNSDASVRRLKGPQRPLIRQNDRAKVLAALTCVDYVIIFDEDTPHEILRGLQPEFLVKGGDYTTDEVIGQEVVETYGGQVTVMGLVEGVSTTHIVETVLSRGST